MASVNPGKRFEKSFKASMDAVGYAMRIPDRCFLAPSGRLLSEPSEGDFLFFAENGHTYLVECKATGQRRLPFDAVKPEQVAELERFDSVSDTCHGVVAINFYGANLREKNALYLVGIADFKRRKAESVRKSLSEEEAGKIGLRCERTKGGIWGLPLQKGPLWESTCTADMDSAKSTTA